MDYALFSVPSILAVDRQPRTLQDAQVVEINHDG